MMNAKFDRTLVRAAGGSRRFLLVDVTAPEAPAREGRIPVNVAIVLDRSGSMGGAKIGLARDAAVQAIRMLRPEDRFSVVVYDDVVELIVPSTPATAAARDEAVRALGRVDARSCTDLAGGWLRGCEQVAGHLRGEAVGKVLLLSDGLANRGITDHGELARHARELRDRGVLTSTFGVGRDFDERLMQALATEGGGSYYFIERPEQIPDLLTSELGETLEVVAREAELFVGVPQGARAEVLHEFASAQEARGVRCRLGNLVSGEQRSVVFEVRFPAGKAGDEAVCDVTLTDRDEVFRGETASFALRFAADAESAGQPRDPAVIRAAAEVLGMRAEREALEENRARDFGRAREVLREAARRIRDFAGDDPGARRIADRLEEKAEEFGREMDTMAMKHHHFLSETVLKSKTFEGKARRTRRGPEPGRHGGEAYRLDTASRHPIAEIGGARCLLDTGSPASFGRGEVSFGGEVHALGPGLGMVSPEMVSQLLGTRVDALLGTDVLGRRRWVLDWRGGTVEVLPDAIRFDGRPLEAALRFGVPAVGIEVGGAAKLAFVDTGAQLSYLDPADVAGEQPVGEEEDFFPVVGKFRVPVYRKTIEVGGEPFTGRFGVLPDLMRMMLGVAGVGWILGSEWLAGRPVLFDLRAGRIVLAEPVRR